MLSFYKATPKNNGTACSIYASLKEETAYLSLFKQVSWDPTSNSGSFSDDKNKPEFKTVIKFDTNEIALILDFLDTGRPVDITHQILNQTQFIKFEPYLDSKQDKPIQIGYLFSVIITKPAKQTIKFKIGFRFHEGRLIKEFLTVSLRAIFRNKLQVSHSESNDQDDENIKLELFESEPVSGKNVDPEIDGLTEDYDETDLFS